MSPSNTLIKEEEVSLAENRMKSWFQKNFVTRKFVEMTPVWIPLIETTGYLHKYSNMEKGEPVAPPFFFSK